jgi:GNAT superfamily N-acetyltransferase
MLSLLYALVFHQTEAQRGYAVQPVHAQTPKRWESLEIFRRGRRVQGQGIGAALMRHLAAIARGAGLRELIAEVLPDNTQMLMVFEKSGFPLSTKRESGAVHVTLRRL